MARVHVGTAMIIKKITINFVLFLLLFAIFDLIFSNFIYKETFRYACYKYDIDFYSLQSNCVAFEKQEPTNKNFKVYTDENGHRFPPLYNNFKKVIDVKQF